MHFLPKQPILAEIAEYSEENEYSAVYEGSVTLEHRTFVFGRNQKWPFRLYTT